MTQHEFFTQVLKSLEACGISYMVSGSVGAMLYGEPRWTAVNGTGPVGES